jgi:uncharacterized protein YjgD (DUF1641 family)
MSSNAVHGSSDVEHLVRAANDALTDDMVTRIAQTAAEGMDLIDQVNRSGVKRALPAIASLVDNGDLDRLVKLARVYGSAEDALSDDIVGRLAETVSEGMTTLDRFNRGGAGKLLSILERLDASGGLDRLAETLPRLIDRLGQIEALLAAVERADAVSKTSATSHGGATGFFKLLSNPANQDALRYLVTLGKELGDGAKRGT